MDEMALAVWHTMFIMWCTIFNFFVLFCMYVYCTYYAPICRANGMEKASFARIVGAEILVMV